MKLDNNKYALKSYLINKQTEISKDLITGALSQEDRDKLEYGLSIIIDVMKICDARNRY